jgi:hypothetical protein
VTGSDKYSLNIGVFHSFLVALAQSTQSFDVTSFELLLLVEQRKHNVFELSEPTDADQGMLSEFRWEKGKENYHVKTVGIRGKSDS